MEKYRSDALDADGVLLLAAEFPGKIGAEFISWFKRADDTIDGKIKQKAYSLFGSAFNKCLGSYGSLFCWNGL